MYQSTSFNLKNISCENEIPSYISNSPLGDLIKYHNLKSGYKEYEKAELVIVMCMDNRKQLQIPNRFAYILRTAGARITGAEFKLSFAIGFGGIRHVALIAHTNCGMVHLTNKREKVVEGLTNNAGWTKEQAENHFDSFAPFFEIENEVSFIVSESKRLKEKYPKITFLPMLYKIEDNKLYIIET